MMRGLFQWSLLLPCVFAFYPYPDLETIHSHHARAVSHHVISKREPLYIYKPDSRHNNTLGDHSVRAPLRKGPRIGPKLHSRGAPNSMSVAQDGSDYSYYSTFSFGSSAKQLTLLFDSGSPRTWVFGGDCTSPACKAHNKLSKTDSTSLQLTDQQFNVNYGSGTVSGSYAKDVVTFAGFDKVPMTFGYATKASDDFLNYPIDGILGLGQPRSGIPPTVMQALVAANLIKQNVFGLDLSRASDHLGDGEIVFGSWDASKFSGDLNWQPSVTKESYWQIAFPSAGLDNTPSLFGSGKTAIIDSGTSSIFLPPADATALCSKIKGCVVQNEESTVPCDTTTNLIIKFGAITYSIPPKDWVGPTVSGSGNMCNSNIIGRQVFGANDWLLGDIFLKNVYVVFDLDQSRIGLGQKNPNSASTSPASVVAGASSAQTASGSTPASGNSGSGTTTSSASNTSSSILSKASTSSATGSMTGLIPAGPSSTSPSGSAATATAGQAGSSSSASSSSSSANPTMMPQSSAIKLVLTWRWAGSAILILWLSNL